MSDAVLIALITGSLTLIGVIITAYPSSYMETNGIVPYKLEPKCATNLLL